MKKILIVLLCVPMVLLSGLGYGVLAGYLVRGREPWFTLCMLAGLGATIALIAWAGGIPTSWALWTFAGAALLYLALRLLFGEGSALEMVVPTHMAALLALLFWPALESARMKAAGTPAIRASAAAQYPAQYLRYQTSTSSSVTAGGTGLTKS